MQNTKQGFISRFIMPPMMKFLNTRGVTAIKNGMLYPIPFIIIGSIFLILANFPIAAVKNWLTEIGWAAIFTQAYAASFGIMAVFAAFGIAYAWVKNEGFDAVPAGMTGIVTLILLQPSTLKAVTAIGDSTNTPIVGKFQVASALDASWLGGKGMILAIIAGLLVGWSYSWFLKKKIIIRLPEQVPENVAASFSALIPGFIITFVAMLIYALTTLTTKETPIEWVYQLIQTPLQHVTDGPVGLLVIAFLPVFIWWFGVHGTTIISGIMTPLLLANAADNAKLNKAGELSLSNGAHIITQGFMDQFIVVTGTGMTLGFVIFMLYRAKSVQMKTIGKLAIGPSLFNINEPVLFGMPVVLNPILAVPFILQPFLSAVLTYLVIWLHVIPPFNGYIAPWTTPPILSGLIVGGWQAAIWQGIMILMSVAIYWPFAARYDKVLKEEEEKAYAAEQVAD